MCGILPYMLYYTEHKVAGPCPRPLFSDKNHCFYIRHKIRLYNCNHICNLLFLLYLLHLRIFHGHCKHRHSSQLDILNILDPTRPHLDSMLWKRLHRLYPENFSWLSLKIPIVWPAPLVLTWPFSKTIASFKHWWFMLAFMTANIFENGHASVLWFQIPWSWFFWSRLKPFFYFLFIFFKKRITRKTIIFATSTSIF